MEEKKKKRFFSRHTKSSAIVASVAVHVVIIVAALSFVAFKVIVEEKPAFQHAGEVEHPPLIPKTPQIKVDSATALKSAMPEIIVAKPKDIALVDTVIPDTKGVNIGTPYGTGKKLPNITEFSPLGNNTGTGNELIGIFYDLKQTDDGKPTGMDNDRCMEIINRFVSSGWSEKKFSGFFRAPREKYATHFMISEIGAHVAPEAFGVEDQVKPSLWVVHYKGKIAAPETGRYRFCGLGDDALLVRLNRKLVLDACWYQHVGKMSDWESKEKNNRKFPLEHSDMVIGDWFSLRKGQAVEMEVVISEIPGNLFCAVLLIEQEGKEYKMVSTPAGPRPVLPIFKTMELPEQMIPAMGIKPDQETAKGPVFGVLTNTK